MMTNNTLLPINWKLSGLENLGEDFSVSAEAGTIPPLTTLPFHAFFRAQKVRNPSVSFWIKKVHSKD